MPKFNKVRPTQPQLRGTRICAALDDDLEDEDYLDSIQSELENLASGRSMLNSDPAEGGISRLRLLRDTDSFGGRRRKPVRRGPPPKPRWTSESTSLTNLPTTLRVWYAYLLEAPGQPLLLGSLALLIGFFLAGALSTTFGAAAFWEPIIAIGPLLVSERISKEYYSRKIYERPQTLRLLNAMKNGFYLGIAFDALKLAG